MALLEIYDEMFGVFGERNVEVRWPYQKLNRWIEEQSFNRLRKKAKKAKDIFQSTGVTFNVYGDQEGVERVIPFDVIPRIMTSDEWSHIENGIRQRIMAINAFLHDIYHNQEIIKAGILPAELILNNHAFMPQMMGINPPGNIYTHIVGIDIVSTGPNEFFVLEDNVRVPSGVSYMLENRKTMMHMFPELFELNRIRNINQYPQQLYQSLSECINGTINSSMPTVSVLTPGIFNSAYFEHAFLADEMGAELIEGSDLIFHEGRVALRTTEGPQPVDIIYRRIDDHFIDPLNFHSKSRLGMPGLFDAYRAGKVMLANAPGVGIADDKAVYSYMQDIVHFYTGEEPKLNNVKTWRCAESSHLSYVLDNLNQLVVKEVHGSGGYGMLVGPAASKTEITEFSVKLKANPENYIAQPTLALSTVPILTRSGLAPRHVDLRPFVLVSPVDIRITPGGLTRVALRENSLVVNSSQGGGTKDTWVMQD